MGGVVQYLQDLTGMGKIVIIRVLELGDYSWAPLKHWKEKMTNVTNYNLR